MNDRETGTPEVALPKGASASTLFHSLLSDAIASFDDVFDGLEAPKTAKTFKKNLATFLIEFEQRRRSSSRAAEIAAFIVNRSQQAMHLGSTLLSQLEPTPGLDIEELPGDAASAGWLPEISYDNARFAGSELRSLVDGLVERGHIGPGAEQTLERAIARLEQNGGKLDLSGERFALLGAGAEIAPTAALLAAGATVLWCDIHPPPAELASTAGRLLHARGRGDLLAVPHQILEAVRRFASDEGPVHLGLFAYAPGKGREWRLGAAMNAVARRLPKESLRSVGLYISPTSPAAPEARDAERAKTRWGNRPSWQRLLTGMGALRINRSSPSEPWISDTIVPIQGVSYQAAQYIEKTLAMEALAHERPELRVCAPVAPVTKTRSIEHPIFAAAFRGTRIFEVEAFPPEVTRVMCALIYLEDVLSGTTAGPRYFHGGLFTLPFALEGAIRIAALKGTVTRS